MSRTVTSVLCVVLACLASPVISAAELPFAWTNDAMMKTMSADSKMAVSNNRYITNPKRAYPPSCLTLPLPINPSGPQLSGTLGFISALDGSTKPVDLTIWRAPCSESKAVILVTIEGTPLEFLTMPTFVGVQDDGDGEQEDEDAIYFRLATEPNTLVQGTTSFIIPPSGAITFVLEIAEATLRAPNLNNLFGIGAQYPLGPIVINATMVDPFDAADYPPLGDMPLSGYLTGSYYDPEHSGEGMLLEVIEAGETLLAVVTWYTFDSAGYAFWLVGAAPFSPGDTEVTIPLSSRYGGGLAGDFDSADLTNLDWGNITISFPNCNSLHFTYEATHSINGLPTGSGERDWNRLTTVNRLACE